MTASASSAQPAGKVPAIVFPVVGEVQYQDDFGDPRSQGGHEGNDIMAPRKAIEVAAESGWIRFHTTSANAGCMLYLYGASGTTYLYIHLNNDLGSGNDNRGKCVAGVSYWPGLTDGAHVSAGQPIGFVGDSGDANGVHPHLHFEVHPNDGAATDPFPFLNRAQHLLFFAPSGSTVTLSLAGTVLSSAPNSLTLKVALLRVFPGNIRQRNLSQPITLALPPGSMAASAESLTGKRVVVLSTPFEITTDALLGKGLAAAQVALVVGA